MNEQIKALKDSRHQLDFKLEETRARECEKAQEIVAKMDKFQEFWQSVNVSDDAEESVRNVMDLHGELEKLNASQEALEARLASYEITPSFQLIMKKEDTGSSRKTSAANRGTGSLTAELPNSSPPVVSLITRRGKSIIASSSRNLQFFPGFRNLQKEQSVLHA